MVRPCKWVLRIFAFVLCIACLVAPVQPVSAVPEEAEVPAAQEEDAGFYTYTAVIHWSASYSSTVVGQLKDGAEISVQGQSGSFYQLSGCGTRAYIAKSQVKTLSDGKYYVSCDPDSSETRKMPYYTSMDALVLRTQILELTKKQLGSRYVFGGTRPGAFDCSGLTYYIFGQNGISLHRGGSSQPGDGIVVAKEDLQIGDLVFFRVPGEPYVSSHMGIYVGDNKIIHASSSRGVSYANLDGYWFKDYYQCARRVINAAQVGIAAAPSLDASSALDYTSGGLRTSN